MTSKLFEFKILEASVFCEKQRNNSDLSKNMKKGFVNFLSCLDSYLDIFDINLAEGLEIKIYGSATLENGAILCATNKFHNQPWFSNVAITMNSEELFEYESDCGICYAQVISYYYNNFKTINYKLTKIFII